MEFYLLQRWAIPKTGTAMQKLHLLSVHNNTTVPAALTSTKFRQCKWVSFCCSVLSRYSQWTNNMIWIRCLENAVCHTAGSSWMHGNTNLPVCLIWKHSSHNSKHNATVQTLYVWAGVEQEQEALSQRLYDSLTCMMHPRWGMMEGTLKAAHWSCMRQACFPGPVRTVSKHLVPDHWGGL